MDGRMLEMQQAALLRRREVGCAGAGWAAAVGLRVILGLHS